MILELTDEVRMESDIPIRQVEWFRFFWKPCSHAVFRAEGVWDKAGGHGTEQYDESSLKVLTATAAALVSESKSTST